MDNWKLSFVMPSLRIKKPFENSNDPIVAIVPYNDERVQNVCANSAGAERLINCFIDICGKKIEPSVFIIKENPSIDLWQSDTLVSYRNIVALSIILKGWACFGSGQSWLGPLHSNSFDFYPITIGKDDSLIYDTPAQISSIRNLSLVLVPPEPVLKDCPTSFDTTLFDCLSAIWNNRYVTPKADYQTLERIFRSIEMAYHAASVPDKNQSSIFDFGVNISLWVSSFEILAHANGNVCLDTVLALVGGYVWGEDALNDSIYPRLIKQKKQSLPSTVNLARSIYEKLYILRNDFLHGNKIEADKLYVFDSPQNGFLLEYVPIIYRAALFSYFETHKLLGNADCSFKIRKGFGDIDNENCLKKLLP